jgi:hypothetical protein
MLQNNRLSADLCFARNGLSELTPARVDLRNSYAVIEREGLELLSLSPEFLLL